MRDPTKSNTLRAVEPEHHQWRSSGTWEGGAVKSEEWPEYTPDPEFSLEPAEGEVSYEESYEASAEYSEPAQEWEPEPVHEPEPAVVSKPAPARPPPVRPPPSVSCLPPFRFFLLLVLSFSLPPL